MGSTDNEGNQPKTVLWHPSNFADYMKQQMGMISANQMYNNEFLMFAEVWKLIEQIKEAINQKTIDLSQKPNLRLDVDALRKLDKIYNGTCYLVKNENNVWLFFYDKPDGIDENNLQQVPALKSFNPTKTIDSDDWAIMIRELVAIKWAWSGYDYATLLTEGKFINVFSDKIVAKMKSDELDSLKFKTHSVSRNYYNNTLDVLKKLWLKQWNILFVNLHQIVEHLEKGSFQTFEKSEKSFTGGD